MSPACWKSSKKIPLTSLGFLLLLRACIEMTYSMLGTIRHLENT
jgi:hypothetical protein